MFSSVDVQADESEVGGFISPAEQHGQQDWSRTNAIPRHLWESFEGIASWRSLASIPVAQYPQCSRREDAHAIGQTGQG